MDAPPATKPPAAQSPAAHPSGTHLSAAHPSYPHPPDTSITLSVSRASWVAAFLLTARRRPGVMAAGVFLAVLVVAAAAGPVALTGLAPDAQDYDATYLPPGSPGHFLGTDSLGRDLASRLLSGARLSLGIAAAAAGINLGLGVAFGAAAGWLGGWADTALMRLADTLSAVPTTLVVILLMVHLDQGAANILLAIGFSYWITMARLVRGEVMALKPREFVQAARALGAGPWRIMTRHVLPNCAGTIAVALALFIPEAIFTEAFLSYVGLGVPAPQASWGTLAADGARELRSHPWLLAWPAAAIATTMLAFNTLADGMREG